jgi:hypothetical protein
MRHIMVIDQGAKAFGLRDHLEELPGDLMCSWERQALFSRLYRLWLQLFLRRGGRTGGYQEQRSKVQLRILLVRSCK